MATSMKLQIVYDKKNNKVIFAEANKDFVDFIFHILSLPLGAVQRIIAKNTPSASLGSIGTLDEGFKNLDAKYTEDPAKFYIKNQLKAPYWGKNTTLLLPEASLPGPRQFYICSDHIVLIGMPCSHNVHFCLPKQANVEGLESELAVVQGNEKGYVKELATFMVMDDLVVRPAEPAFVISLMNQHSVKDVGHIVKREVTFGTAQAMKLLKSSVSSKTVLTDVFLGGAVVKAEN